jgi:tryptophan-specific transport protein
MNFINKAYNQMSVESDANKTPHIIGGVAITAGTAIGAGMFSLPIVSSSMGFGWSILCMSLAWYAMYHASMLILEVNLHFDRGESFYTMVKGILGKKWAIFNSILFASLFYILNYAYISGGSSIVNKMLAGQFDLELSQGFASMIFMLFAGFFVWLSTKAVDRFLTILITAMSLTFIMAVSDLTLLVEYNNLMPKVTNSDSGFLYLFAALPFYLTSFGFHSNVPSLVKYYGKKPKVIARTILLGSLFCIRYFKTSITF